VGTDQIAKEELGLWAHLCLSRLGEEAATTVRASFNNKETLTAEEKVVQTPFLLNQPHLNIQQQSQPDLVRTRRSYRSYSTPNSEVAQPGPYSKVVQVVRRTQQPSHIELEEV
jgi:hypothetical protein